MELHDAISVVGESYLDPYSTLCLLASTGPQSLRLHQNDLYKCGSHIDIVWT